MLGSAYDSSGGHAGTGGSLNYHGSTLLGSAPGEIFLQVRRWASQIVPMDKDETPIESGESSSSMCRQCQFCFGVTCCFGSWPTMRHINFPHDGRAAAIMAARAAAPAACPPTQWHVLRRRAVGDAPCMTCHVRLCILPHHKLLMLCGLLGCGDGSLAMVMAVVAGWCAGCHEVEPPECQCMPISPSACVCKSQDTYMYVRTALVQYWVVRL